MTKNLNVIISDESHQKLLSIKNEARFHSNSDVVEFALDVAVNSEQFKKLKKGFFREAMSPAETRLTKFVEKIVEKKLRERDVEK